MYFEIWDFIKGKSDCTQRMRFNLETNLAFKPFCNFDFFLLHTWSALSSIHFYIVFYPSVIKAQVQSMWSSRKQRLSSFLLVILSSVRWFHCLPIIKQMPNVHQWEEKTSHPVAPLHALPRRMLSVYCNALSSTQTSIGCLSESSTLSSYCTYKGEPTKPEVFL